MNSPKPKPPCPNSARSDPSSAAQQSLAHHEAFLSNLRADVRLSGEPKTPLALPRASVRYGEPGWLSLFMAVAAKPNAFTLREVTSPTRELLVNKLAERYERQWEMNGTVAEFEQIIEIIVVV